MKQLKQDKVQHMDWDTYLALHIRLTKLLSPAYNVSHSETVPA